MRKKTKVVMLSFPDLTEEAINDVVEIIREISQHSEYEFIISNMGNMKTIDKEELLHMLRP